jgi:hypothetical protein
MYASPVMRKINRARSTGPTYRLLNQHGPSFNAGHSNRANRECLHQALALFFIEVRLCANHGCRSTTL